MLEVIVSLELSLTFGGPQIRRMTSRFQRNLTSTEDKLSYDYVLPSTDI